MDDPALVRRLERLADLSRDRLRLVERHRPSRDAIGECLALHELHDEGGRAIRLFEMVNSRDVRVIQGGEDLGFACEPRDAITIEREVGWQKLDRNVAAKLRVARSIHLAHPASTDGGEDFVRPESRARDREACCENVADCNGLPRRLCSVDTRVVLQKLQAGEREVTDYSKSEAAHRMLGDDDAKIRAMTAWWHRGSNMPTVEERLAYLEGQSEQQNVSTSDLRSSVSELRVDVRDLRIELRTEIREVRTELRDVRTEIRDLRADMNQKFTWVMGIQVSTLVMIAGALLSLFFRTPRV